MPESTQIRVKRDGVIVLSDDAGHTYTVAYEPGDLAINVPGQAVNNFLDRGRMGAAPSLRLGDDQPMTLSFTAYLRDLSLDDGATLLDIANRPAGSYVADNWISTSSGDVFTVNASVIVDGADLGEADQQYDFPFCVVRANVSEGDPSTIAISITSYAYQPTVI